MTAPLPADAVRLLADSVGAVAVIDRGWRISQASEAFVALAAAPGDEVIGVQVWRLRPWAADGARQLQAEVADAVQAGRRHDATWHDPSTGCWYEQQVLPRGDQAVLVLRDVTDQHQALERGRSLLAISRAMSGALTAEQVALAAVAEALPLLAAASGGVVLRGEPGAPLAMAWPGVSAEALERWQGLIADAATPIGLVLRTGEPVFAPDLEAVAARWPDVAAELAALGRQALAALPLTSGRRFIGVLVLHFAGATRFTPGDQQFLTTVAAITGQALRRAQLVEREHAASELMQRALLPRTMPRLPAAEIAARYRPAGQGAEVGGDWFDVIELDGSFAVVMGDVEGHDLAAAAAMGQVRSAVRSYALLGHPPALVLANAQAFVTSLHLDRLVTLVLVQVHPTEHLVTVACAGHPLPLLADDDGVRQLAVPVGPPLGVPNEPESVTARLAVRWEERTSVLAPGARMLLFTDGLVERRDADVDEGVAATAASFAAAAVGSAEQIVDAVLAGAGESGGFDDDVAVLALRLGRPVEPLPRRVRRRLPANPIGARVARKFLRDVLKGWQVETELRDTAELLASELLGNAVRHSDEFIELTMDADSHPGLLRVAVFDRSHRLPVVREVEPGDPAGRGLQLVQMLAAAWGVEEQPGGKTVWFQLSLG